MLESQIDGLSIGPVEAWLHEHSQRRSSENAIGYRIRGMPAPLSASIAGFRRWDFYVYKENQQLYRSTDSYGSKEEALIALKAWLSKAELA
jgi:hypothetical protein